METVLCPSVRLYHSTMMMKKNNLTTVRVVSIALLFLIHGLKGFLYRNEYSTIIRRNCNFVMLSSREPFDRNKRTIGPPPPINEYIKADKVRLIAPKLDSDNGEEIMLGIFTLKDALLEAEKLELDLVLINDKADPPVCKIIDYGKFKYSVEKKKKENAKKQVKGDIKEVKVSYKIEQHDFDVRVRAIQKFIGDGDRVRLSKLFISLP